MATTTNGGMIIPVPKHIDLLPHFQVLGELIQHAYEVSTQVSPEYRGFIAQMVGMTCMQLGHEMRIEGYKMKGQQSLEVLDEGQLLINSGKAVRDMVLQ